MRTSLSSALLALSMALLAGVACSSTSEPEETPQGTAGASGLAGSQGGSSGSAGGSTLGGSAGNVGAGTGGSGGSPAGSSGGGQGGAGNAGAGNDGGGGSGGVGAAGTGASGAGQAGAGPAGAGGDAGAGAGGQGGQQGSNCEGHTPPAGLVQQTSFNLANTQLLAASNTEWPSGATLDLTTWNPPPEQLTKKGEKRATIGHFAANPGDTSTVELLQGRYASFKIETSGLAGRAGQLASEQPANNGAPLYLTISACPGDPMPEDERCRSQVSALASMGWSIDAGVKNYCPLVPGTTYYLNVFFIDPAAPEVSTCSTPACWWLVTTSCQIGCPLRARTGWIAGRGRDAALAW